MERIKIACQIFRNAIERADKTKLDELFDNFPEGCCGNTCVILGEYLKILGLGTFYYVEAERNDSSHAWLEHNDVIIDITSDQFLDGNEEIYIGRMNFMKVLK